jgi:hypothetical protein
MWKLNITWLLFSLNAVLQYALSNRSGGSDWITPMGDRVQA